MMIEELPCPFCDEGICPLVREKTDLSHDGRIHHLTGYYYKCNRCGEEFTTTESDTEMFSQIPGFGKIIENDQIEEN